MKAIKIVVIVTQLLLVQSFSIDDPCQQWKKDYKLTWDDFKGALPTTTSDAVALTYAGVSYNSKLMSDTMVVEIKTCFTKEKSWVIAEDTTPYLLNHEQRHFDIAEINTRILRKYALTWDGKYNLNAFLSEGNDNFLRNLNQMNNTYDKETNHSKNKTAQTKWNKKIDSLLNIYSLYENPVVKLPRRKK
jgi:hypothetical protein